MARPNRSTVTVREMGRAQRRAKRLKQPEQQQYYGPRPQKREDCVDGYRPCPFVACKHHLFLEVDVRGAISFQFGEDIDGFDDMPDTCCLDVADRGGIRLEEAAKRFNIGRERMRQNEASGLNKLRRQITELFVNCSPSHTGPAEAAIAKSLDELAVDQLAERLAPEQGSWVPRRRRYG